MSRHSYQRYIMYILIACFAAIWNWICGNRGLFSFDQSFVLDAATRILQGKEIYNDFYAPFGMISYYYTAGFLLLFGNTWSSFVLAGSCLNALMAVLQTALIEQCGEVRSLRLYAAGLLSALGSVAVFGTVYPEYLACAFGLTAALCLVGLQRKPTTAIFLAAIFFALSYHSKQNVAIACIPLLTGICIFSDQLFQGGTLSSKSFRRVCKFFTFSMCFTLLPLVIFYFRGTLSNYLSYALSIPSSLGRKRILFDTPELAGIAAATLVAALFVLIKYWKESSSVDLKERNKMILSMLLVFHALFFSMFLEVTMVQDPFVRHMQMSFLVFLLPVLLSAFMRKAEFSVSPRIGSIIFYFVLFGCVLLSYAQSYYRLGQESVAGASFSAPLHDSYFDSLQWGLPTLTDIEEEKEVSQEELLKVLSVLREHPGKVFIFPDFSSLYSASGKEVFHPFLWFHPGLTYQNTEAADAILLPMLKDEDMSLIVLETSYFDLRLERSLESFEQSHQYISENFSLKERIGIFSIFKRQSQLTEATQ